MHWLPPRNKLDSDQNDACDACIKTILQPEGGRSVHWLQGSAGTGKSVVLVHVMRDVKHQMPNLSMVFVTFTHALKALVRDGLDDVTRAGARVMTAHEFQRERRRCNVLFVDEIQDLDPAMIEYLRTWSDVMVVGGDPVQSIYANGASLEKITEIIAARPLVLDVMYRLTRNLLALAGSVLPSARLQDVKMNRLRNIDVMMGEAETEAQEAEWVWGHARDGAELGTPSAILLPSHAEIQRFANDIARMEGISGLPRVQYVRGRPDYGPMNLALEAAGTPLQYLGNGHGDLEASNFRKLVYLMTYHSAKGLDFERVFLPRLTGKLKIIEKGDPDLPRRLMFVAVTRAREELYLSYAGSDMHWLIEGIPKQLYTRIEVGATSEGDEDDEILF